MSGFKMNPNFEREIKREVQRKLTKVYNRYKGKPVSEVTAALKREGVVNEPALAQAISEGRDPKVA